MKLTQLEYLIAVADHGTVTAAARALYVAQPAVSRAIQLLEGELGVALFDRRAGRLALTPLGADVVAHARRAIGAVTDVRAAAENARGGGRRRLAVATTPTLEEIAAVQLLRLAKELRADVHLVVHSAADPSEVAELVRSGEADLGLSDLRPPPDLATVPLFEDEIVLACPPGSDPSPIDLGDLGDVPLVLPVSGGRRAEFDEFFEHLGVTPSIAVETDDRSAWAAHVLAGLGCAFRYRAQVDRLVREGVVARAVVPPITRHVEVVYAPWRRFGLTAAIVDRLDAG